MYFTVLQQISRFSLRQTGIDSSKRCSSLSDICEHRWLGLLFDLLTYTRGFLVYHIALSVEFMSLEGSKIPKKVFKMSRGVSYYFERGSLFQAFTSAS